MAGSGGSSGGSGKRNGRLARRYAAALLEAAREAKEESRALDELAAVADLADPASGELAVPGFARALESPRVPAGAKRALLDEAAGAMNLAATTRAFLRLVLAKRRFGLLGEIVREYRALLDEAMGLVRARVETAMPLDAARQARLAGALSRYSNGREVQMELIENPALLAGVRARLGNRVLDGSLAGRIVRAVRCASEAAEGEACGGKHAREEKPE